jgi:cycloeucalenol cycloisomerase
MYNMQDIDIAWKMTAILGTGVVGVVTLCSLQTPSLNRSTQTSSSFLPDPVTQPSKRAYEVFTAAYTPFWMGAFVVIVAGQLYEDFTPLGMVLVLGGLALPFLLQPILWPGAGQDSPDAQRPLLQRYATKANVWIAVYSFIGNYWYTHYFYSVLKAAYTMPNAIRLNNVPIGMFCATHFYFSSYHLFSNCLLRKIETTYEKTLVRDVLFVAVIGLFAYFTAFMETLTISAYPYWTFADRDMAYAAGSAFYGIYFIVSFPAFYYFDNNIDAKTSGSANVKQITVWETVVQSCGYGMIILILLDAVRLWLDIPLVVGADAALVLSNLQNPKAA